MTSFGAFAPETTGILREWYEGTLGKRFFAVGPTIPAPSRAPVIDHEDPNGHDVQSIYAFLDAHPPRSVLLISFGSLFYPTKAWQIEALYKAILASRTPFIASRFADTYQKMDPELEGKIEQRVNDGLALVVDYVPQRVILQHRSMGAFLTHGGVNSLFESILAGVLNIFWPVGWDQPLHAAYMSWTVRCLFFVVRVSFSKKECEADEVPV